MKIIMLIFIASGLLFGQTAKESAIKNEPKSKTLCEYYKKKVKKQKKEIKDKTYKTFDIVEHKDNKKREYEYCNS